MKRPKHGAWAAMHLLFGAALPAFGCQDGYPIAATRCDLFCDLRQATECGSYNPAGCVVSCEEVSGGTACHPEFDALLTCLKEHEHEIECNRMVPACKSDHAALYACGMRQMPQGPGSAE
jgi:hypothetical protein